MDFSIFPADIAKKLKGKITTFSKTKRGCRTSRWNLNITIDKEASTREHCLEICEKLYASFKNIYLNNRSDDTKCYFCLEEMQVEDFMVDARVAGNGAQGCHLEPLILNDIKHTASNIKWGHRDCNIAQGNRSVKDALTHFKNIVLAHGIL